MKYFLILIFSVIFVSCATDKYIIKEKLISISVPDAEDTIRVTTKTDTLIIAEHIHLTDTIAIIKYYPQKEKIYYKIRYDTIYIRIKDTVMIEKTQTAHSNHSLIIITGISLILALFFILRRFLPNFG